MAEETRKIRPTKARGKNTYGAFFRLSRSALIEAAREGYRGEIVVFGDLTDENLNYMSELSASEGWHQRSSMRPGDRAVVMRISNDTD
jgi:hypothetical protein